MKERVWKKTEHGHSNKEKKEDMPRREIKGVVKEKKYYVG